MIAVARPRATVLAVAVLGPLTWSAVAFALWWVSDRLLYIGPFDRATFGWAVVMPVWWLTAPAAALLWRGLPACWATFAALAVGASLATFTAALGWASIVSGASSCDYGWAATMGDVVGPMAVLGLVMGGTWAASSLVAAAYVRDGRIWRGVAAGIALLVGSSFLVIVVAGLELMGLPGCNRPPL